jgi:hypothetical protein
MGNASVRNISAGIRSATWWAPLPLPDSMLLPLMPLSGPPFAQAEQQAIREHRHEPPPRPRRMAAHRT